LLAFSLLLLLIRCLILSVDDVFELCIIQKLLIDSLLNLLVGNLSRLSMLSHEVWAI
jgi:hypothetical protein